MNLIEFRPHSLFRPACHGCGARGHVTHADLDGPAWQAYYCTPCTQNLRAGQMRADREARA
jgi:hypothetical protein